MIGELFRIKVSNIVRAAITAVTATLPEDKPASIQLTPAEHGATFKADSTNVILVKRQVVGEILQVEDTAAFWQACQDYFDQMASQLRASITR
ncbi:hypothetical protein [Brevibacterium sp. FME37]|uniref:hypothetical protein n=1 Tax=Brevibacterium sp. FME37 TaxID=2742607 RepID=UPI001867545D|nr:hypothetical protein [Brevibacterium sp. FME37]